MSGMGLWGMQCGRGLRVKRAGIDPPSVSFISHNAINLYTHNFISTPLIPTPNQVEGKLRSGSSSELHADAGLDPDFHRDERKEESAVFRLVILTKRNAGLCDSKIK